MNSGLQHKPIDMLLIARNVGHRECISRRFLPEKHPTTQWLRATTYWAHDAVSWHPGPDSAGQDFRTWLAPWCACGRGRWAGGCVLGVGWRPAGRGGGDSWTQPASPGSCTAVPGSESGERTSLSRVHVCSDPSDEST